jgi:hypothetical protein
MIDITLSMLDLSALNAHHALLLVDHVLVLIEMVVIRFQGMAISRHLPQYPHLQEDFNVAEAEDIITVCLIFSFYFGYE